MMSKRGRKHRSAKGSAQGSAALERNGLRAFQEANYDRAIDAWERVARQTPGRTPAAALAEAHFRRGLQHWQASELEASLSDLQRASELQPEDPCYAHHLGLAAYRIGDLDRAIRSFTVAQRGNTEFAERAAYPLALARFQQGDDPSAHPVWSALSDEERTMLRYASAFRRRPYSLPPEAPELWRGLAALDAGDLEGAHHTLQGVVEGGASALEQGVAHYYLGVLAADAERWEDAARCWNAARAAGYTSPWLVENAGELYHRLAEDRLQEGDIESALGAAQEARRLKTGESRLGELLSQVYEREGYRAAADGEWEEALECWQAANEVGGGRFRLAYNLALAYEQAEDWIMAGETWREALRRRPRREDHPDAVTDEEVARLWRRAAEAYDRAGEHEEAASVYRQALKWNPDDLQTRMALAETLLNDGRLVAAQNELDRILERDPDHIPALLRMGEAIAEDEHWWHQSSAPTYWRRVLELDPENASARQSLVEFMLDRAENMVYWGSHALAIKDLEEALSLQPNDGRVLASLGTCYLAMGDEERAQYYIELAKARDPGNLGIYSTLLEAWLDQENTERAQEVLAEVEAAIEDIPFAFYMSQATLCLESEEEELARPWLERAVDKAPPGEPILMMIGEMAMMAQAPTIAREYLERAVEAGQQGGQAQLILGIVAMLADDDPKTARKHWRQAEKLARREGDEELMDRIEIARAFFTAPPGLLGLLRDAPFFVDDFDPSDYFDEDIDDDF